MNATPYPIQASRDIGPWVIRVDLIQVFEIRGAQTLQKIRGKSFAGPPEHLGKLSFVPCSSHDASLWQVFAAWLDR
jgi:hypothetical protein